ncbi:MAG: hypothetical protein HPY57_01400 [Ignavibacteria bacterium]|nr:hypothetical protein [Ignavibacteria bacterium]
MGTTIIYGSLSLDFSARFYGAVHWNKSGGCDDWKPGSGSGSFHREAPVRSVDSNSQIATVLAKMDDMIGKRGQFFTIDKRE